jgi:hypothetical protein
MNVEIRQVRRARRNFSAFDLHGFGWQSFSPSARPATVVPPFSTKRQISLAEAHRFPERFSHILGNDQKKWRRKTSFSRRRLILLWRIRPELLVRATFEATISSSGLPSTSGLLDLVGSMQSCNLA